MMQISKNQAAFLTVGVLAALSVGSILAAIGTASKVATLAYGAFGAASGASAAAACTAWLDKSSVTGPEYFEAFKAQSKITMKGMYQQLTPPVLQTLVQSGMQAGSDYYHKVTAGSRFSIFIN